MVTLRANFVIYATLPLILLAQYSAFTTLLTTQCLTLFLLNVRLHLAPQLATTLRNVMNRISFYHYVQAEDVEGTEHVRLLLGLLATVIATTHHLLETEYALLTVSSVSPHSN